jgi:CDP-diacylglycerol--glycerol-3-phosphate 3-phosphatidyltransferase
MQFIPSSLVITRFLLGLVLFADALDGKTNIWFALGLTLGLLSDIFDGIIARRVGTASQRLRELDSRVDVFFMACIAISAWLAHREVIIILSTPILIMLIIYTASIVIPWAKFHRLPAYHAYSAKLAGLVLFLAALDLFANDRGGLLLKIAIIAAFISHLDRIAITILLPNWHSDVPGVWEAWKIRNEDQQ